MHLLRRLLLIITVSWLFSDVAHAQSVSCNGEGSNGDFFLSVELFAENIGTLTDLTGSITDLTGYNTYRIHLNTEGPLDILNAVYGDDVHPLNISSTQPFHQSPLFSGTSNALVNVNNPLLFSTFPELEYDSWLTIGIDQTHNASAGETAIYLVEDPLAPFATTFANGGNVEINSSTGGAWYTDNPDLYTNGIAGVDGQVLIAQLTTNGPVSGQMELQVFRDGEANSENCIRPYLGFQSHGCTDPNACNFEPTAILSDGSCNFCSCLDSAQVLTASFPSDSIPGYSIEVDLIADHDTTGVVTDIFGNPDPLAGMKTYRMYLKVDNPATTVLAAYGNDSEPLDISSTEPFFQSALGSLVATDINPSLFPFFPVVQYDSWVTIGAEQIPAAYPAGSGYDVVTTAGNWSDAFNDGGGLYANTAIGGVWAAVPGTQNTIPDGDLRILLAQFTTAGIISGTLGAQIIPFDAPIGTDCRLPFSFTTEELGLWEEVASPLCDCDGIPDVDGDGVCDDVDPCIGVYDYCGVCNGPGAIYDCGCYDIPEEECDCFGNTLDALGVCGGDCEADEDGDGVCDDEEVFGCTDPESCTYLAEATEEDGSCLYADAIGTCGGDCALDFDGNGICDTDDAAHCGPGTHWDFEVGLCVISCPSDINLDGAVAIGDLLTLLSQFANFCSDLE